MDSSLSTTSDRFICFVKSGKNKFDVILRDRRSDSWVTMADILPHIVDIFHLALGYNIRPGSTIFEVSFNGIDSTFVTLEQLLDASNKQWTIITRPNARISYLSLIIVNENAVSISQDLPLVSGIETYFLDVLGKERDIIAFYLMVQSIEPNVILIAEDSRLEWQWVCERVTQLDERLFGHYSPQMCRKLFETLTQFYSANFNAINMKLEPRFQRTFDLLKIIHRLDPFITFKGWTLYSILRIAEQKVIKNFMYFQRKYHFDVNVGTFGRDVSFESLLRYVKFGRNINTWFETIDRRFDADN